MLTRWTGQTIRAARGTPLTSLTIHRILDMSSNHFCAPDLGRVELDRAIGVVIGSAAGDALGAGYEFDHAPEPDDVMLRPGTLTGEPAGYWTDDTAMAIAILEVAATDGTLITDHAATAVGERFLEWYRSGPGDIGNQTRAVLTRAASGADLTTAAAAEQVSQPDRAGNGSLMRTGPVALPHLGNEHDLVAAARAMSALTHPNPYALDACVLWTFAVDHAIRTGDLLGPRAGLHHIEEARRPQWEQWIVDAETFDPRSFNPNGYVVTALQAAWSAIHSTRDSRDHFAAGLRQAVAIGDDTDTVAAIAGSLLGATYGVSSVPLDWHTGLAGWPEGYRDVDLVQLAVRAAQRT
jgi:ADP-ribosylglycohydrolase